MKVLLLNPPKYLSSGMREGRCTGVAKGEFTIPPISLAYVASILSGAGHDIKLIDAIPLGYTMDDIVKKSEKMNPDLIIVNTSLETFFGDIETIKNLRANANAKVAAIGNHVTAVPEKSLEYSRGVFDVVIRGEPEITSLDLANELEKKKYNLQGIKGISFASGKKIYHNTDRDPIENLDELPFPARNMLPKSYKSFEVRKHPFTLLYTSRGCPFRCIYCTTKNFYGKVFRPRSPENIIDEIKTIKEQGFKEVRFWDDTFNIDNERVERICRLMVKEGIDMPWTCLARSDLLRKKTAIEMKRAGCHLVSLGVESGSPEVLERIKKNLTVEQIRSAFGILREVGIDSMGFFMFGNIGDNRQRMEKTLQLAKELNPHFASFNISVPFPGTEFYEEAKKLGLLVSEDWYDYSSLENKWIKTEDMAPEQLSRFVRDAEREYYMRPAHLLRRGFKIFDYDMKNTIRAFIWMVRSQP